MRVNKYSVTVRALTRWETTLTEALETTLGYTPGAALVVGFNREGQEDTLEWDTFRVWVESHGLDERVATEAFYNWLVQGYGVVPVAFEDGEDFSKDPELRRRLEGWKKDRPFKPNDTETLPAEPTRGPINKPQKLGKTAGMLRIAGILILGGGLCLVTGLLSDPLSTLLVWIGLALGNIGLIVAIASCRTAGK